MQTTAGRRSTMSPPRATPSPVQDLIATSPAMLVNAGSEFQNQMIGSRENQTIPPARAAYYAANGTPAIDGDGTHVTWSTATGIWS